MEKNIEMTNFSMIVAMSLNCAIGKNNKLIWHIDEDLQRFKKLTEKNTVVMGRKTYESLPKKPLPNRRNIILTHSKDFNANGCEIVNNIDELIHIVKDEEKVFVIGGASIYKQMIPFTDTIYITCIHEIYDGDTFFPFEDIEKIYAKEDTSMTKKDKKNGLEYHYEIYKKKYNERI